MRLGKRYLKKFKHNCLGKDKLKIVIKVTFARIGRVAYVYNEYRKRYDDLTYDKVKESQIIGDSVEELLMKLAINGISEDECVFCPMCRIDYDIIPYFPYLSAAYPLVEHLSLQKNKM